MENKKELTIGEQRIGITFEIYNNPYEMKSIEADFSIKMAEAINIVEELKHLDPRLAAILMTDIEKVEALFRKFARY